MRSDELGACANEVIAGSVVAATNVVTAPKVSRRLIGGWSLMMSSLNSCTLQFIGSISVRAINSPFYGLTARVGLHSAHPGLTRLGQSSSILS
jgi:hypothetical protein